MARASDMTPRVAILSQGTRSAIEAMGGLENAEQVTSARRSQLSRCQSRHDGDTLSLRDAHALDDATLGLGGPHILRAMARLLDHVVIPVPTAPSDHDEIKAQIMDVTIELGELSREAIEAERDGLWSRAELTRAYEQAIDLVTSAVAVRTTLFRLLYPDAPAEGQTA